MRRRWSRIHGAKGGMDTDKILGIILFVIPEIFYRGSVEVEIPDIAWRLCKQSERVEFRE